MTAKHAGTRLSTVVAVRVRADGVVDEEALAYAQAKVDAVLSRPGLPPAGGEVRITKAAAHHTAQPWSAVAELVVGNAYVVVHAQEATAHELADRLQNRLRGQMMRALHRSDTARRSAMPPPWRSGRAAS
ncbi:hypothetical protein [Streptomyces colonosanans]|uniref:Uncharacterized protein n=1 Tax=Streptomyces colonosanans TaxID=1428652 RepID=A0A1S2PL54_9ACTN|nr:hypothetical protein [Streptomyces colonosanans]OIJ94539.1 hypothetical protein BIV24_10270 [Streptomyces colonosanans]